mmetsp:Transcript_86407/g.239614  ORF Transcript_86407/g.239614 Transcript_86407/m.239614 type:complete len:200 (-) Transcript_86407:992-1591(-)
MSAPAETLTTSRGQRGRANLRPPGLGLERRGQTPEVECQARHCVTSLQDSHQTPDDAHNNAKRDDRRVPYPRPRPLPERPRHHRRGNVHQERRQQRALHRLELAKVRQEASNAYDHRKQRRREETMLHPRQRLLSPEGLQQAAAQSGKLHRVSEERGDADRHARGDRPRVCGGVVEEQVPVREAPERQEAKHHHEPILQ